MFLKLLISIVNASDHIKLVLLSNQDYDIQCTFINLHPSEYTQYFHHYPFTVQLDKYVGSFRTLNRLSNKVYVPNKREDLNLSGFNMITWINESKTLTKHTSS